MSGTSEEQNKPLTILLADDDKDDRFFFDKALRLLFFRTQLATVEDGEALLKCLFENADKLPDVLFLDLNMPKKSGSECLLEIKSIPAFEKLRIIIYSTSLREEEADFLYENGADYYVQKCDFEELVEILLNVLVLIKKQMSRPTRDKFIFRSVKQV